MTWKSWFSKNCFFFKYCKRTYKSPMHERQWVIRGSHRSCTLETPRFANNKIWLGCTTSSLGPFIEIYAPALLQRGQGALEHILWLAPSRLDGAAGDNNDYYRTTKLYVVLGNFILLKSYGPCSWSGYFAPTACVIDLYLHANLSVRFYCS